MAIRTISGTVTHLERIALPPGAVLSVKLLDVSRADAPATVLAAAALPVEHQVPVPFQLTVDDADVDQNARLTIWASLRSDVGRWQTDTSNPVTLDDGDATIEVIVRSVPEG